MLSIDSEDEVAVLKNKLMDKVIIKIRNKRGKRSLKTTKIISGGKKKPPLAAFRPPDLEAADTIELQDMKQKFRNDLEKFKDTKSKFMLARPLSSRHSVNFKIHDFSLLNESKGIDSKHS